MRKIKHSCNDSQVTYQLATLAITQVGMMRKFRSSEGFKHDVVLDDPAVAGRSGEYIARPWSGQTVHVTTETDNGCWTRWLFTWPDLKLLSYEIVMCSCTGYELDLTVVG